jgi:hypothetical protein
LVFGHSSADIAHLISRRTKWRTEGPSSGRGSGTKRSDQKASRNDVLQHGFPPLIFFARGNFAQRQWD